MTRFIDWNGDGQIAPVDIGISKAIEEHEQNSQEPTNKSSNPGCLSAISILIVMIFAINGSLNL